MAVTKSVLKLSESEAVVKVAGTSAAATIVLAEDLLSDSQELHTTIQPASNITGVQWTGASAAVVTITRGGVTVMTLSAGTAGFLDMSGQAMIPDSTNNQNDIVVTVSGGQAECWLRLRKVAGYVSKIETAAYGIYDDTTKVGE